MSKKLKIIPLGGLDQIGMNITAFEYDNSIVVVDCGIAFPEDDMLGVDLVIPNINYLLDNEEKVKGFVITHGHEDHIGAIPYIMAQICRPIYATRLTNALIEGKLREHRLDEITSLNTVNFGETISFGDIKVEFIKTNHSIVDACALAIHTPVGTIVHTGDFKVDYTPVFGDSIDLNRFAQLGSEGVLALLCDSTNADRPGITNSEKTVGKTFDSLFSDHTNSRIIISTFASNVDRVQQIINTACKFGRKVVIDGRSMVNIIQAATELGYISIPDNTLIDIEELNNYPDEKTVIITTGSQGEAMAALNRIATSMHKKVRIKPGDTVIFSSNPIPGNEKAVYKVINELSMKGAEVIFQDAHVSGHACQEEIKLIYSLVKPKYSIPVHGEHRHLRAQAKIAGELGIPADNIFVLETGDVLSVDSKSAKVTGKVETGAVFVDGLGVGDIGNVVLRDRQVLAENGIVMVILTMDIGSEMVISGPEIITRGFIYVKESDELMQEMREVVTETIENLIDRNCTDRNKIRNCIKDALGSFIFKRMKRRPMILPVIMNINE